MASGSSLPSAQSPRVFLPEPAGLTACSGDDSVASVEKRLAPRLGAEFLGCFKSEETASVRGTSATRPVPMEYAIAFRVLGGPFNPADVDALLSRVRDQWKNYNPLSKQHSEYVARLNAMIQGQDSKPNATPIASIKPILISIDRLSPEAYLVLSVRHYVSAGDTGEITSTKASGAVMVLQGTQLIRLEILRELRNPSDVDIVRQQVVAWAHEIAVHAEGNPRSQ